MYWNRIIDTIAYPLLLQVICKLSSILHPDSILMENMLHPVYYPRLLYFSVQVPIVVGSVVYSFLIKLLQPL